MRVILGIACVLLVVVITAVLVDGNSVMAWAVAQQRAFQNEMAQAVRSLQMGAPGAWTALLLACGAYGFVHALGPGHGKYLLGGVALGSTARLGPLLGLSVISSLAQALWAITLVYGGFTLLDLSVQSMTSLAEDILAPLSYLAIATVGAILIRRGIRLLRPAPLPQAELAHADPPSEVCATCGHAHGPTAEQVSGLTSWRDAAALVFSIAVRPCTGAIFLLVIAWQMDIRWAGAAGALAMGLGTALLTASVSASGFAARGLALAGSTRLGAAATILPALHIAAGILIIWGSLTLLGLSRL